MCMAYQVNSGEKEICRKIQFYDISRFLIIDELRQKTCIMSTDSEQNK